MGKNHLDLRFILASPLIYRLFSTMVGQGPARKVYVNDYIRPQAGDRILDIGCGPGDIVEHLPEGIQYFGFDMSPVYINAAQKRFGKRARFMCKQLDEEVIKEQELFDMVIAIGVLHHLDDNDGTRLFQLANHALNPGGRVVTIDPVFYSGQPQLEYWLVSRDRGEYVRYEDDYLRLIPAELKLVKTDMRRGLLRMPYSLLVMECTRQ